jgi:hypothetical protein
MYFRSIIFNVLIYHIFLGMIYKAVVLWCFDKNHHFGCKINVGPILLVPSFTKALFVISYCICILIWNALTEL